MVLHWVAFIRRALLRRKRLIFCAQMELTELYVFHNRLTGGGCIWDRLRLGR